jgi:hypothetical protein
MTFQTDFLIAGSQISVGYTKDETVTTGTSHAYTKTWTVSFNVEVPPYSKMKAIAVLKQGAYDVPWTATAQVTYQGKPPQAMTLHGVLQGVTTADVEAQYTLVK